MIFRFLKGFLDHICNNNVVALVPKDRIEEDRTINITSQLENIPNELIHRILSLLPVKDAARTCILSKSWLRAWSTNPKLRFTNCLLSDKKQGQEIKYIDLVDRMLLRYFNANIPIEHFDLHLDIVNGPLYSAAQKWLKSLASRSRLKEFSLTICFKYGVWYNIKLGSITIPGEIFSCENLNTLSVRVDSYIAENVTMKGNPVIKCSFLRVLELLNVKISEGTLHNLLSSCSLLEKIHIFSHRDLEIIRVKNLPRLQELRINAEADVEKILEIYNVPSLRLFSYKTIFTYTLRSDSLQSVREVVLRRAVVDDAFLDMIKSKFPCLESLTLNMNMCKVETLDITCASLKRLTVSVGAHMQINVQVNASKLLYFCYEGAKIPRLLFRNSSPEHIKLIIYFFKSDPIDQSFFIEMREALNISSNFDIEIKDNFVPMNIDLDDLRRRVPFPARNVQQLLFKQNEHSEIPLWQDSPPLDLFFSICYPRYIKAYYRPYTNNKFLYILMARGLMEKKSAELKGIEAKNRRNGKWETLTNSCICSYENANDYNTDEFKLSWCS